MSEYLVVIEHEGNSWGAYVPDLPGVATVTASASPYAADPFPALRQAGARLADADMLMMHCIGYTEAMRQAVMQAAGRPVLLSRRLVAHAIDLLLT